MVEQESYTCPACGMTSYHPEDVRHEYCGNCHKTRLEVEADRKEPHILRTEDLVKEDLQGDGAALVTEDRAIIERGKLDVGDYSVMATTAHGLNLSLLILTFINPF